MSHLALRWAVTLLFSVSIAIYAYLPGFQRRRSADTVNHLLHLAMSVAMILMAWDVGMNLPTAGAMSFFLAAGFWFARAAWRMSSANGDRLTNAYYAVMMGGMAWMFAVMAGTLPGQLGHPPGHAPSAAVAMDTSGTGTMSAQEMSPTAPGAEWITTVNWIAALGFAVVALWGACSYVARRRINEVPQTGQRAPLEPLYQVCTAAGTAVMFGGLL
ncbi:hypothetical protein A5705_09935 [Mycobacterium sp. E787]|nr:hypothetical protein A5705_09935 [Mycobacterium sp. E787]